MIKALTIIEAIRDEQLFRPFIGRDLSTWKPWMTALRVVYGLPTKSTFSRRLIQQCTGRRSDTLPKDGFKTALFLTGRRSGKSRIAAVIGAFEAVLAGHESKLSKGERGVVPIVSPTKAQGRIVKGYLRSIFEAPLFQEQVIDEQKEGFTLKSGTRIEILSGDSKTVRGYTLLAAVIDEAAFLGIDDDSKVRSDTELVRALKPALATVGGRLVAISSPYARRGWCFKVHKANFGNDAGKTLVWNCPSRVMNSTLPQSVVDEALAEDLQAGKSEWLGEFRDDITAFLPREVIERLVVADRLELLPRDQTRYVAFVDLSGGRSDDSALAIAHLSSGKVVLDFARRWTPPFNPHQVVAEMAEVLRRYRIKKVTGDNYAGEWVASSFVACGIAYTKSDLSASQLYVELLPRLCSAGIELLDDQIAVTQLSSLERRTRSGGRDIVDHPPNGHDDLANAISGVAYYTARKRLTIGAGGF